MVYEDESVNLEQAWESFSEKAKSRPRHSLWENHEWSHKELKDYKTQTEPSVVRKLEIPPVQEYLAKKAKKKWSVWTGTAVASVLAGLLLFGPWSGKIMADMLKTFTVQNLQGVRVSQNELSTIENALTKATPGGKTFHIKDFGKITKFGGGQVQQLTLGEASSKMDSNILYFPESTSHSMITYEPGMRIHLKLNVTMVNRMIKKLGGKTSLPASLEGQTIQLVLPAVMTMNQPGNPQVTLNEESVPQLNVPNDVDVERVKKAVLGLPIIPESIRQRIEGTTDWKKTFYVPMTNQADHVTTVNDHQAVIYHQNSGSVSQRALIWLENGHIYMLSGPENTFSTDQSIIKKAKEIMNHGANHSNQ